MKVPVIRESVVARRRRQQELDNAVGADLAVLLANIHDRMGEFVTALRGNIANDVLFSGLVVIPAAGVYNLEFEVPYASVAVDSYATANIFISNAPPQIGAASSGPGTKQVGPGGASVLNLAGRSLTIYGPAGAVVDVQVFTHPQPPSWAANTGTVAGAPASGTLTDRSGTIALGGTAQSLAPANPARRYLFVQNNSAGDLWINFTATAVLAQPSIKLAAGASTTPVSFVSTEAVSIIGATTGQAYTAKEG